MHNQTNRPSISLGRVGKKFCKFAATAAEYRILGAGAMAPQAHLFGLCWQKTWQIARAVLDTGSRSPQLPRPSVLTKSLANCQCW